MHLSEMVFELVLVTLMLIVMNEDGTSPLKIAEKRGHTKIVDFLKSIVKS